MEDRCNILLNLDSRWALDSTREERCTLIRCRIRTRVVAPTVTRVLTAQREIDLLAVRENILSCCPHQLYFSVFPSLAIYLFFA